MYLLQARDVNTALIRYGVATVIAVIAFFCSAFAWDIIEDSRFLFFMAGVAIAAWYGGLGPGLLNAFISVLLANYYLVEPRFELAGGYTQVLQVVIFGLLAFIISLTQQRRLEFEEELEQSRNQFKIIVEGIAEGITVLSPTEGYIYVNPFAAELLGFETQEELLQALKDNALEGKIEITKEDGVPIQPEEFPVLRAIEEGVAAQALIHVRVPEKRIDKWMTLKSTPMFDSDRKVEMVINIVRDITDRYHYEDMLRNQRERLRVTLESIADGVIATDKNGAIEYINPVAQSLTGWQSERAVGKPLGEVFELVDQTSREPITGPIKKVLHEESARVTAEKVLVSKGAITGDSDVLIEYTAAPIATDDNESVGGVVVFRDVTLRRRAEQERTALMVMLDSQRQRLRNILMNVPGIIWEGTGQPNGSQKIEFVNPFAEKMLGYSVDEWMNTPDFWTKIIHPDDLQNAITEASRIYESGEPGVMQFRCVGKDGRVVWVASYTTVITDSKGVPTGACGAIMDISDRRQAQEALEQSALELRRSNEELQQFAYVASHDLQEPLRMVTSYLQLVEQRYKDKLDSDASEFIAYAVDGASRMKALINDLLMYSRVNTRQGQLNQFEVQTVLDRAMNNLQLRIEESGAIITHDPMPKITGDENQFTQLFQNLIGNAIKFRGEKIPEIHIGVRKDKREWVFCVKDNGIGIDKPYLDRIFIIFQRLHGQGKYPGTGIGLAICKKVVERHGGRIWVESSPGMGSTFYFTVPLRQERGVVYASN
jgi:PAS domain S-box-containing protein